MIETAFAGRISGCLNSVLSKVALKLARHPDDLIKILLNRESGRKGCLNGADRIPDPTLENYMSVTMREMLEAGV
ncbi:MAG: hypothetical protein V4857_24225, partial [Pseudomonadota bacterium]